MQSQARVACRTHLGESQGQDPSAGVYREGWIEGYQEVLAGGAGEPPVVPPERFWQPKLRHGQDAHQLAHWRSGFIDGAATARACGQQGYGTVPASAPHRTLQPFEQVYTASNFATLAQPWQETEMHSSPSPPLPPMPMPLPPIPERMEGGLPQVQDSDDATPSPSDRLPGELEPSGLLPSQLDPEIEESEIREADSHEPFEELDLLSQAKRRGGMPSAAEEAQLDRAFAKLRNASQTMRSGSPVVRIANASGAVVTPHRGAVPPRDSQRGSKPLPPATSPWSRPTMQLR